tara:strand:+ start:1233 stop:2864 length:1632 start_codon:yes stop_codon:yes gene_type:complete
MFIKSIFFNFGSVLLSVIQHLRNIYLNSRIYNKKISKIDDKVIVYKPSQNILNCLIKFNKKKYNIEDFSLNSVWEKSSNLSDKNFRNLHSFFWLFSLDLRSSQKVTQNVIFNWIGENYKYRKDVWDLDILSKRIIAWISNSKLTYENGENDYKLHFNNLVKKQTNHLINEINRSDKLDDKIIGSTAIILVGLTYGDKYYLKFGIDILRQLLNFSLDISNFPKSRNLRQLVFYLKYLIIIREILKESQTNIPDFLDESIFYLGKSYNLLCANKKNGMLFNGNFQDFNAEFDDYLNFHKYKFKDDSIETGGYVVLKNKKTALVIDIGRAPEKKFSRDYQAGVLSFEFNFLGEKVVTNSGYFQDYKHQLNIISKSSATHSTLVLDNLSTVKFERDKHGHMLVNKNFKILNKEIKFNKDFWQIKASHDAYLKSYGVIHERQLTYTHDVNKLEGRDKLIKSKNFQSCNFAIRFHLLPEINLTKLLNNESILIESKNAGWKFTCKNHRIDVEKGLYFGMKNKYLENKNILIIGKTIPDEQDIFWEISKI